MQPHLLATGTGVASNFDCGAQNGKILWRYFDDIFGDVKSVFFTELDHERGLAALF